MVLLAGFVLCLLATLTTLLFPDLGAKWFSKIERLLNCFAKHRMWAVLSVGVAALALRIALLPIRADPTARDPR